MENPRLPLRRKLFLPDEGIQWPELGSHLPATDFPVAPQMPFSFPFPAPLTFGTQRADRETWNRPFPFPATKFAPIQLAAAPRTTGAKYSAPSDAAKHLCKNQATRLEYIYRSSLIWDRAKAFALGPGQTLAAGHSNPVVLDINGIDLGNLPPRPVPLPHFPPLNINAWDDWSQGLIPLPTPDLQADAMCGLFHHYSSQRRRFTPFVNSEPAIQAEFIAQYLTPVNLWLMVSFLFMVSAVLSFELMGDIVDSIQPTGIFVRRPVSVHEQDEENLHLLPRPPATLLRPLPVLGSCCTSRTCSYIRKETRWLP